MSASQPINVLIAAGGTGGHILPAIALGRALAKDWGAHVHYLCGTRPVELDLYQREGIEPFVVPVRQLGNSLRERVRGLAAVGAVSWQVGQFIRAQKINVVVGMGGYVAGPALLAALLMRRATVIHEANSVPGRTNRWVARWVNVAAVNFPCTCAALRGANCLAVGMPIREEVTRGQREEGYSSFQLDRAKQTLLILGGSQGARNLYRSILEALPTLDIPRATCLQLLWSTGVNNFSELSDAISKLNLKHLTVRLFPFISRMDLALASADAAISRAGVSTIAELLATGVYALYVPLPSAIYDHQRKNAEQLVKAGLGMMVTEQELQPDRLARALWELLEKAPTKRNDILKAGAFHREAASRLARVVVEAAGR